MMASVQTEDQGRSVTATSCAQGSVVAEPVPSEALSSPGMHRITQLVATDKLSEIATNGPSAHLLSRPSNELIDLSSLGFLNFSPLNLFSNKPRATGSKVIKVKHGDDNRGNTPLSQATEDVASPVHHATRTE